MKRKKKALKPLSPHEARTMDQQCSLQSDNLSVKAGWILLNSTGTVILKNQRDGEQPTGSVEFTRRDFARFANWYLKPQKRVTRS